MANNVEIVVKVKDKATALMKRMMQTTKEMFKNLTSMAALLMSAGSLAVPLFAKSLVAVAHGGAAAGGAIAPLLGLVPALAGGMMFLKFTLGGVADGWKKAFKKSKDMENLQKQVSDVALRGVPSLARSLQTVTFKHIKNDMLDVGKGLNVIIKGTLKWAQSAAGIKAIGNVTHTTAEWFRYLAPQIVKTVAALGNLAGRGAHQAIGELAIGIDKLLKKIEKLANNTSAKEMWDAWDTVGNVLSNTAEKFKVVWQWVEYIASSANHVKILADVFAGLGIVVGAMMGNWVAMAVGIVSIIVNHWEGLSQFFTKLWQDIANNPGFQGVYNALLNIFNIVQRDLATVMMYITQSFQMFIDVVKDAWNAAAPFVENFLKNEQVITGIRTMAIAFVALVGALALIAAAVVVAAGAIMAALGLLLSWLVGVFVAFFKWLGPEIKREWDLIVKEATPFVTAMINAFNWWLNGVRARISEMVAAWNMLRQAWNQTVAWVVALIRSLIVSYNSMRAQITSACNGAMIAARMIFNSAMAALVSIVTGGLNRLRALFNSVKGFITGAFSGAASWLFNSGRSVIDGFVSGIRSGFGKVSSAVSSMKSMVGFAHGGIIGAATGGVRSGLTLVGEHGPELVSMAPGSRVHSNPDSRRMAGSSGFGGGGGGGVTLYLESSGSAVDNMLLEILRKVIRVRGGDVQTVLGRSR